MNRRLRSGNWVENEKLASRLEGCHQLPTPGPAAARLIELIGSAEPDPADLAEAVELQPQLTQRTVLLANHPLRNSRRRARNLRQVIAHLGQASSAHLALALALDRDLAAAPGICLDRQAYWKRARQRALASWALAGPAELAVPEEALLCGLLQDVGLLALDVVLPEFYPELRADAPRSPEALETLEGSLVSVPHSRLSAWLLRRWGLSLRLQSAVACSHDSTAADSAEDKLAACVELSASLGALALQPANSERSRQLAADAKRLLALTPADVARVHRQAAMTLNEAQSAFDGTAEGETPNRTVVSLSTVATLHQAPRVTQLATDSSGYSTLPDPVTTALTLERELAASRHHGWPLSVALLQTAGCGTPLAQRSLDQAVWALRRTLRPSDLMGRHDQDRLLVTMPGAGRDEAAAAARRITQALAEVGLEGLGVATTSPEAPMDSWESLLALAERALSAAWRVGSGICSAG